MAVPWQVMNKIRSKIKRVTGVSDGYVVANKSNPIGSRVHIDDILLDDKFYTFDYDTNQIVTNYKIADTHFIFDLQGDLIKSHKD